MAMEHLTLLNSFNIGEL